MKGNVGKEKTKKMLKGQSSREADPNFKQKVTLDKANQ
jgi:hypothetical protein